MTQVGVTEDGRPVYDGVFFFVGTEGLPLDVVIDTLNGQKMAICWPSYFRDAMNDGAKYQNVRAKVLAAVGGVFGQDYLDKFTTKLDEWFA